MSEVNGVGLLKAEIRMSRLGAWHADIETEESLDVSEGVEIEVDGETFVGTALPGRHGVNGTRYIAKVVGGAGGLSLELPAKSYEHPAGVTVRAVLVDILRACGETLSATAEAAVLDTRLPRWHRIEGIASRQLLKLATHVNADWRVLADGSVWIGAATWPQATVEHVLEDEDWTNGTISIAPESPSLRPGVTFLDQHIESVAHTIDNEGKLRTECHIDGKRSAFQTFVRGIQQEIDYSRLYRCRIVTQNADRTVQVDPDDATIKGRGLDKVPIRLGMPGFRAYVSKGARCMLGFNGGDPSDPYVCNFDEDQEDELVRIVMTKDGREAAIMRVGDPVLVPFPYTPMVGSVTPLQLVGFGQSGNSNYQA